MKKLLFVALASLSLAACSTTTPTGVAVTNGMTTAANIGMDVFKYTVDQKCRTEIQSNNAWKVASKVMTSAQQMTTLNNVCGCVSEKAPQTVTIVELGQAAVDTNVRAQVVSKAVTSTLSACYSEFVK